MGCSRRNGKHPVLTQAGRHRDHGSLWNRVRAIPFDHGRLIGPGDRGRRGLRNHHLQSQGIRLACSSGCLGRKSSCESDAGCKLRPVDQSTPSGADRPTIDGQHLLQMWHPVECFGLAVQRVPHHPHGGSGAHSYRHYCCTRDAVLGICYDLRWRRYRNVVDAKVRQAKHSEGASANSPVLAGCDSGGMPGSDRTVGLELSRSRCEQHLQLDFARWLDSLQCHAAAGWH